MQETRLSGYQDGCGIAARFGFHKNEHITWASCFAEATQDKKAHPTNRAKVPCEDSNVDYEPRHGPLRGLK
ncbi:MAG: hypothetical protein ABFD79_14960 [Phycisphaerales bacterium]